MKTLLVKAGAAGSLVPRENSTRKITSTEAVEVPNTPYYRRRINTGELVQVDRPGDAQ